MGLARSRGRTLMARARSLAEFQKSFSDEESCAAFLFKRRWPDGFVCPGCGKRRAVGLKSRPRLHECLDCGRQTSVTAGTMMHRSKLPLTTWFWAAHLMTTHSNGMSARQLEDQLGVTYKTAWLLTQKLRRSMVDPNREPLEGVVEVDQAESLSARAMHSSNPATPGRSSSLAPSRSLIAPAIKPNRAASTPNISIRVPAACASP
jgi:transposase-like protein